MRVLVTGASGFIGSHIVPLLEEKGDTVTGWSRIEVDLLDREKVEVGLNQVRPDIIFHLASAGVNPERPKTVDLVSDEMRMTDNLIAAATPKSSFIVAGSMAEYGQSGRLREDMLCLPNSIYGIAKLASSLHALAVSREHSIGVCVARLFGIYGEGEAPHRLMAQLHSNLSRNHPVDLSDGSQLRDFIHVEDACRALIDLGSATQANGELGIVNVGTGHALPIERVCREIADKYGADPSLLRFNRLPRRVTDEDMLEADTDLLKRSIGWIPTQRFGR